MTRFGIHLRLLIAAFLVIGAVTVSLGILGIEITNRFMHERFEDRIGFLARYLAMNSEVGVLINDYRGLHSLALNLLGEEDVARVVILDNEDHAMVDLSRPESEPLSMVETPVVFKRASGENVLFDDRARMQNPFIRNPPEPEVYIGKVRIYFSTKSIDGLMNIIARKFTWLSLGAAVMAGLVFYLISRPMGEALKQLTTVAQQIGRGDTGLRVMPGRLPETRALAFSFNAMLDSLQKSQHALEKVHQEMGRQRALAEVGKFSLMIAHEVKNPLAIIKSSLDIMKREFSIGSSHTMVAYIEDEIERLNRLIEAFLQFARPTKPAFRDVDLNRMLSDVIQRFQMLHAEDGLAVKAVLADEPAPARADRDLLIRAFDNLIENACQAGGPRGWVSVTSTIADQWWQASIADSGEGIDPAIQERIFEPFFTTRNKGTGLGLAFATQVFHSHGGTIKATNAPGGGAEFIVRIPLEIKEGFLSTLQTAQSVNSQV